MSALTVFRYLDTELRIEDRNGNPWFHAREVCNILGIKNVSQALTGLRPSDRDNLISNDVVGRQKRVNIVSESGLYALIFKSRMKQALDFQYWVTSEVLPAIRKNGLYNIGGPAWKLVRSEGKQTRKNTTDVYKKFIQYARDSGSKSPEMYYQNFSKMVNSALIELEGIKPANIRDQMSVIQLHAISVAEHIIGRSLNLCMTENLPYKDIYQIAKNKINIYAQSVGKTLLGASERQCLGLTEGAAI